MNSEFAPSGRYPSDSYGQRMTKILGDYPCLQRNMTLKKGLPTIPDPQEHGAIPQPNLCSQSNLPAKSPNATKPHSKPCFCPDSWKKCGQDHEQPAGSMARIAWCLWAPRYGSRGLSGKQVPNAQGLRPGNFSPRLEPRQGAQKPQGANNDFWTARGYDFIRFAAHIGPELKANGNRNYHIRQTVVPSNAGSRAHYIRCHGVAHETPSFPDFLHWHETSQCAGTAPEKTANSGAGRIAHQEYPG